MYSKKQRIAAVCGIIILVGLYLFTLIAAIFDFDGTGRLFLACLVCTIVIPIIIWVYIWLYGIRKRNQNNSSDSAEKNESETVAKN